MRPTPEYVKIAQSWGDLCVYYDGSWWTEAGNTMVKVEGRWKNKTEYGPYPHD